jgi:hypothetical protein
MHGCDDFSTGIYTIWTGESQETLTNQAVTQATGSSGIGEIADIGIGFAGAGVLAKSQMLKNIPTTAKGVTKYGPHTLGPLEEDVINAFRGGVYTERVLTEDLIVYRVYGGDAKKMSQWFTTIKPQGPAQAQIDLALNPQWGNTATKITTVKIPKGTMIYEGFAEQQIVVNPGGSTFILQGGGTQIYVPVPKISWFLD